MRLAQRHSSRFARNEALARAVVRPAVVAKTAPLEVAAAAREAMAAALGPGRAPVVLHPGSSPGAAYKRWPAARFAELARVLALLGSARTQRLPDERKPARELLVVVEDD